MTLDEIADEIGQAMIRVDGFDHCCIGITDEPDPVFVYDADLIIKELIGMGMADWEAREYYEYNILGCFISDQMPIFIDRGYFND